jgi:hypothetical protein
MPAHYIVYVLQCLLITTELMHPGFCTSAVVSSLALSPFPDGLRSMSRFRYCPVEVRKKALKLLDCVVPKGSLFRGVMRRCARLAQPKDLPHLFAVWCWSMYTAAKDMISGGVNAVLSSLFAHRSSA